MKKKIRAGLGRFAAVIIVIILIAIVAGVLYYLGEVVYHYHSMHKITTTIATNSTTIPITTSSVTTAVTTSSALLPPNSSVLVDIAQTVAPDSLDPATDFLDQVEPLFYAVYQELVEPNGSNYLQVVPVIAQNWSTSNYENWTFYLRPYVHFSDGNPVNASVVWFSFYRTILMGQPPAVADYIGILFNSTIYANTGYAIPWGVNNAIQNVTGLPTANNFTFTAQVLASILSHFNANNQTIQKIMEYPYQAVVVKGPYEVEINTLEPYRYFLLDIANSWGAIVDPAYIDQHGGVEPNTPNTYANLYGIPGTGPYVIKSVGVSFSSILLVANPNYWAINHSVPLIAEPPHIKVIEIYYGLSHTDRVEDFIYNKAQITYVSIPYLNQILQYYKNSSEVFYNFGVLPGVSFISMNTQKYPTNITDLRLAIVHAINYSALMQLFEYNGKSLAILPLGPISPQYGKLYNPDNLSFYTYNLTLALHYLNEAGYEGHFYVVLPNGTVIGDSNGSQLQTLEIDALAPATQLEEEELNIISQDLSQIGISVSVRYVTFSIIESFDTPQSTPNMVAIEWTPDWPDPVFQQLMPLTDVQFGGASGNFAWFNNSELQQFYQTLPFITNTTEQAIIIGKIYNIIYNQAPYIWLPFQSSYYIIQPYVKGIVFTDVDGYLIYFYNTMYYE
ncbi:ABC transporter substrate-binding protein [Saccharolobus caldissimus]|uniref:Peptide ABC transporter permease n=1 Tax=Saccharolobus caldissimus TaxID=1702097 RepID=A0AAQ4CUT6_9CREN|nr:ABC transporter substrate-binding protein [Saccharolobus caldissimus]BDB99567.1 peptide ABC transporter permease [Saccharolobus caldissimus]